MFNINVLIQPYSKGWLCKKTLLFNMPNIFVSPYIICTFSISVFYVYSFSLIIIQYKPVSTSLLALNCIGRPVFETFLFNKVLTVFLRPVVQATRSSVICSLEFAHFAYQESPLQESRSRSSYFWTSHATRANGAGDTPLSTFPWS